jgi:hypothetical protein
MTGDADTAGGSLVDLLHPDGHAATVLVLGHGPIDNLCALSHAADRCEVAMADAVVLAPDAAEGRSAAWLRDATHRAAIALAPDGLIVATMPRDQRLRLAQGLRAHGLVQGTSLLRARHAGSNEYFVPCVDVVARHVSSVVPMSARNRRAWRLAWGTPMSAGLIPHLAAPVLTLARLPGGRPLMSWVRGPSAVPTSGASHALVRLKRSGDLVSAVVTLIPNGAAMPTTYIKVPLSKASAGAVRKEADLLAWLGGEGKVAGAAVPSVSVQPSPFAGPMLTLSALPGRPAVALLQEHPQLLRPLLERVGAWLGDWAQLSASPHRADGGRLHDEVIRPAAAIAAQLTDGAAYLERLRAVCAAVTGAPLPGVGVHGDLTMSNVIVPLEGPIGVVDWEHARADGLPLVDFIYAAGDAVAASRRYVDRTGAFLSCFDARTEDGQWLSGMLSRLADGSGVDRRTARLLRHAAIVQHAADEVRRPHDQQPFLAIAQQLAREPLPLDLAA